MAWSVLTRFWRPPMLPCRDVVELVTAYLDDALSRRDRRRVDAHLALCPHCREYLAQIRATIRVTGAVDLGVLAPHAREELLDLYRRVQGRG